jgi:transposase
MAYGKDFKECALGYYEEHSYVETRAVFGIAKSTLCQWQKESEAGFPEKPKRSCEKKINKAALIQAVQEKPDAELAELAEPFGCTPQAVFYALRNLGITLKKRPSGTLKPLRNNAQSS